MTIINTVMIWPHVIRGGSQKSSREIENQFMESCTEHGFPIMFWSQMFWIPPPSLAQHMFFFSPCPNLYRAN